MGCTVECLAYKTRSGLEGLSDLVIASLGGEHKVIRGTAVGKSDRKTIVAWH